MHNNNDFMYCIGEDDYNQSTTFLTFTSAESTDRIEFSIVNDTNVFELAEEFTITTSRGLFFASARIAILNNGEHTEIFIDF